MHRVVISLGLWGFVALSLDREVYMSHIFISYSRKDIDYAGKIVQALAENDLDTWIDWEDIPKKEVMKLLEIL